VGHQVSFFVTQAGRLDLEAVIRAAGEICLRAWQVISLRADRASHHRRLGGPLSRRGCTHFMVQRQVLPGEAACGALVAPRASPL
jgi:hypothetical protein